MKPTTVSKLIGGLHSGHDCAYCVLENGIPIVHAELERYVRLKEPFGDSFELLMKDFDRAEEIQSFAHTLCTWKGGLIKRHPESFVKMWKQIAKNDGIFSQPGHHEAHAANAFFSSNFNKAIIVTIDGGGRDYFNEDITTTCTTWWAGENNKLDFLGLWQDYEINIGGFWASITRDVFCLSIGYPKGNQCGTVMAMAAFGDPNRYIDQIRRYGFNPYKFRAEAPILKREMQTEQDKFDLAAALQLGTEEILCRLVEGLLAQIPTKNLCFSGGVALNSVAMGKIAENFGVDIYIPPVPPDAGLSIGSAQYAWHVDMKQPRVLWGGNVTPYLGKSYTVKDLSVVISKFFDKIKQNKSDDKDIINYLYNGEIVSIFNGKSESGRRALGNRSILADPRPNDMKNKINEKVKHRQWFRPFAPSILRERVSDWFTIDADSPYMSMCLRFKPEKLDLVPAVVHKDGTARLQTVTIKDNLWYYNFLKLWEQKSGVPILLNTSFNDTEPIVETPEDAIKCFLGTEIDKLYFPEYGILVEKKQNDIS